MYSSESALSSLNKSTFTTADLYTKSGSWQITVFSFELHYTFCVLRVDRKTEITDSATDRLGFSNSLPA